MELKNIGLISAEVEYMRLLYYKVDNLINDSQRNREIFMYRYGVLDNIAHSFGECGKKFGISRARAQQIVYQVCAKMHQIENDKGIQIFIEPKSP